MLNKKYVIIAVSAVLVIALAGIGIIGTAKIISDKKDTQTTLAPSDVAPSSQNGETGTDASAETETTAVAQNLSELILGKWTDSANMSGYEFFADGTVNITYVNLTVPFVNIPINGTAKGTYTLNGDMLTTKCSIYSGTIDDTFRVSIENNSLSMFNVEEHETATYTRDNSASDPTNTSGGQADETELTGSWTNSDGSVKYSFNQDSTVDMVFVSASVPSVSSKPVSGSYKGVYVTDGNTVTIQYSVDSKKITDKFEYTTSKNTLTLQSENDTTLFIRVGTESAPDISSDDGIIGKWSDGANMSGYEFKPGGVVVISYVNFTVPVINMPINGSFTGSYSIDGNKISINYSVYGKAVNDVFTYTISDNALNLTDSEGKTTTYIKQ